MQEQQWIKEEEELEVGKQGVVVHDLHFSLHIHHLLLE
jgi:hypothetical protein